MIRTSCFDETFRRSFRGPFELGTPAARSRTIGSRSASFSLESELSTQIVTVNDDARDTKDTRRKRKIPSIRTTVMVLMTPFETKDRFILISCRGADHHVEPLL